MGNALHSMCGQFCIVGAPPSSRHDEYTSAQCYPQHGSLGWPAEASSPQVVENEFLDDTCERPQSMVRLSCRTQKTASKSRTIAKTIACLAPDARTVLHHRGACRLQADGFTGRNCD